MKIKDIQAFRAVQGFVGNDDYRPALKGVLIEPDGTIVATDGHILFIGKDMVDASDLKKAVIVEPEKTLHKYSTIATIDMQNQRIVTDKGNISFKVIKEPYVKYESAIPSGSIISIDSIGLTTNVMGKAMLALDSFRNKGQTVPFKFTFRGALTGIIVSLNHRSDIQVVIMPARI